MNTALKIKELEHEPGGTEPQCVARQVLPSTALEFRPAAEAPRQPSLVDLFFRKKFIALFSKLSEGYIELDDPTGSLQFGDRDHDIHCKITMSHVSSYREIAMSGSNGAAQAYIDGQWHTDRLSDLMRILVRNQDVLSRMESGLATLAQMTMKVWHGLNKNSRQGSKKNIAAHYDLGNEFFRLFLDDRMMYSSALYKSGDNLDAASTRKLRRICETLALTQDDHIVEIGSGWGGFACYAARHYGCRVTTVTISQEQFDEANALIKRSNLSHLVTLELKDYRDIEGEFDKLVSIEMIEAVGHQYLNTYFNKINALLKPGGKALLQAIVIDDSQYQRALKEVDFIKRYIFPGSFIPCYSVISQVAANNKLMLENLLDIGLSYAQTLRDWRQRFYENIDAIGRQGYDQSFLRMWEFYLCYCEGGFDERAISAGQILLRKQASA